jgi:hypothetical protein
VAYHELKAIAAFAGFNRIRLEDARSNQEAVDQRWFG